MTRIVLLLTAIPLAAVLALIFNTLLDRRLAAIAAPAHRASEPGRKRPLGLWLVLALLPAGAAAPALAHTSDPVAASACASMDCSLLADAARVDRLWEPAPELGVEVVAQSRIPVWFDDDSAPGSDEGEAEASQAGEAPSPGPAATRGPTTGRAPR